MPLIVQDVIVSLVALGALGIIVWRVVDVARPGRKAAACHGCATGKSSCSAVPAAPSASDVRPVVFVRSKE